MKPTAINEGGFQFTENGNSAPETNSFLSFHQVNREVLRITHDGHMICGEGLSVNAATQEAAKLLIASFEEQIQEMVDARAEKAEAELAAEREKVSVLRDALELITNQADACKGFCDTFTPSSRIKARAALAATEVKP
jgi:hypothetical protein